MTLTFLLLIVFTDGQRLVIDNYQSRDACLAAAEALRVPVFTNLTPGADSVRQIGLDAYCLPETD